jgi:hypothetical protein
MPGDPQRMLYLNLGLDILSSDSLVPEHLFQNIKKVHLTILIAKDDTCSDLREILTQLLACSRLAPKVNT